MGDKDSVLQRIWGNDTPTNEAMEEGTRCHEIVSSKKIKLLPIMDDAWIWESDTEGFYTWNVYDWLTIRAKIDCWNGKDIVIDWKTGHRKSILQDTKQIWFYAWILKSKGYDIKKGYIVKLDKDLKVEGITEVTITEEKLIAIANWAETIASEIFTEINNA